MSKIFITGDIHGEMEVNSRFATKRFPYGKTLTKEDFVIVAGDFGLIWSNDPENRTEKYHLKQLQERAWTTLFIDGNHENHTRLQDLPIEEMWGGKVGVVREGIYYLRRGEIYTLYGKKIFCFGGALSWDKDGRTPYVSWWPEEIPNHKEMEYALSNLDRHNWDVDYVITHTIPNTLVKVVGLKGDKKDATCDFLDHIESKIKFKKWFAGHMHIDKSIGKSRILYNDIINIETDEVVN